MLTADEYLFYQDSNKAKKYGWTALMEAAHEGKTEMVDLLIKKGAKSNMRLKSDWTARCAAKENGHSKIVDMLARAEKEE